MEPSLDDLVASLSNQDIKDFVAGLRLPLDCTTSQFIFELVEAYYLAQEKINNENESSLKFIGNPTDTKVQEQADGSYRLTRTYLLSGVIHLGINGFSPLS